MMKNINKHFWYYLVSVTIFLVGLVLIVLTNYSHQLQSTFIIMTACLYFVWSLAHHYVHHQLHPKVVIEYALMATLGVLLSFFLFNA